MNHGIAVYIAHNLEKEDGDEKEGNGNILNFTGTQYAHFKTLEERGAKMYMLLNEVEDSEVKGGIVEKHIREFYRGFWVKPEAKEAMEKVDTVFAFYGSHVDGLEPVMEKELEGFMKRMKKLFGENFGITHGKGPGIMRMADKIAEKNTNFIQRLMDFDAVIIAGQAKSHCVAWTNTVHTGSRSPG